MAKEEQITAQAAIDRYADMVYRLALSQMKNTTDADDLFQEVFVRLVRHIQDLESWEHVKAWLIRVTINCARKHYEQYWNRNVDYMEEPERIADAGEIYEPPEEHPVGAAVQTLPPKYRLVIHLYYYEELPVARIAELTDQKESTVKSQMRRAREMLKEILGKGTGNWWLKIKEKVNLQDMMDQFENGCKDQYKKETSQIHASAGLIERTKLAVAEEERRLQAETKSVGKEQTWQDGQKRPTDTDIERQSTKKPGGHHWNYDRVFRWGFSAAAAVILLFAVHRSAMLWGTGAGRTSKDSASGMAGAESYEEDGSMNGSEEEAADSSEAAAAGGAETDMLEAEPDSEKYAEAEMEDHAIQQFAPAKTENSTSASEETAGDTDAERGVGADRIEELEKKYSEEDLASQISITEVDKKPDFYDRSDTDRVVSQGITFYVTQSTIAEEEADKTGAEKEEWSAYVEYNGKKYVITGQAADQDEFLEKAYENLIFF